MSDLSSSCVTEAPPEEKQGPWSVELRREGERDPKRDRDKDSPRGEPWRQGRWREGGNERRNEQREAMERGGMETESEEEWSQEMGGRKLSARPPPSPSQCQAKLQTQMHPIGRLAPDCSEVLLGSPGQGCRGSHHPSPRHNPATHAEGPLCKGVWESRRRHICPGVPGGLSPSLAGNPPLNTSTAPSTRNPGLLAETETTPRFRYATPVTIC